MGCAFSFSKSTNMYVQEISIKVNSDVDKNLVIDEFSWLMAQFHRNGQVLNGSQTQFINGSQIVALPYTLERDSLSKKYFNSYVTRQIKRVESLCDSRFSFRTIGTDYENSDETCSCGQTNAYFLSALYLSRDSAITCGNCHKSVPLYRLPKLQDDSYVSILNWQLSSMICDGLETINLDNPDFPPLSSPMIKAVQKQGLEICREIEAKTNIPTHLATARAQKKTKLQSKREFSQA